MSKLLYILEDHFDALAERRQGITGLISRGLRTLFGYAGDVMQGPVAKPHRF